MVVQASAGGDGDVGDGGGSAEARGRALTAKVRKRVFEVSVCKTPARQGARIDHIVDKGEWQRQGFVFASATIKGQAAGAPSMADASIMSDAAAAAPASTDAQAQGQAAVLMLPPRTDPCFADS